MDQYCILGRIGEGAHGIVFKAKHVEVRPRRVCSPRVPAALPSVRSFGVKICQRSGLGGSLGYLAGSDLGRSRFQRLVCRSASPSRPFRSS